MAFTLSSLGLVILVMTNLLILHLCPQGLQEMHCLHHLVPGPGAVGAGSYPIKYSASVGYNESSDTPFVSVSSPQGLQDAHGLHLLVPGAGVMGARTK